MHELDLHGYTVDEALRLFVDYYNRHLQRGATGPIRVIHGYGSTGQGGKIRPKFREYLNEVLGKLDWIPGERVEANDGITIVYPRQTLPTREKRLEQDILVFCSAPRTESKITGQFRKDSPAEIKRAIRNLVRSGRLREVFKGNHQTYVRIE